MLVYNSETHYYEGKTLRVEEDAFSEAADDLRRELLADAEQQGCDLRLDDAADQAWEQCLREDTWTLDMEGVTNDLNT